MSRSLFIYLQHIRKSGVKLCKIEARTPIVLYYKLVAIKYIDPYFLNQVPDIISEIESMSEIPQFSYTRKLSSKQTYVGSVVRYTEGRNIRLRYQITVSDKDRVCQLTKRFQVAQCVITPLILYLLCQRYEQALQIFARDIASPLRVLN